MSIVSDFFSGVANTTISWTTNRLLPWVTAGVASVTAYFTEMVRDTFFWIIRKCFELLLWIIDLFADRLGVNSQTFSLSYWADQLPVETLAMAGYLRIPECIAILVVGLAASVARRVVLRI